MIPRLNSLNTSFGAKTSPRNAYSDLMTTNNLIADNQNKIALGLVAPVAQNNNGGFVSMQGAQPAMQGNVGQKLNVLA